MKKTLKKIKLNLEESLDRISTKDKVKYALLNIAGVVGYVICGAGIMTSNPYVKGNLGDSFLSGGVYCGFRYWGLSKFSSALITFSLASLGEVSQRVLHYGTFDPIDILAYGLGTTLAVGIDYITENKVEKRTLESILDYKIIERQ